MERSYETLRHLIISAGEQVLVASVLAFHMIVFALMTIPETISSATSLGELAWDQLSSPSPHAPAGDLTFRLIKIWTTHVVEVELPRVRNLAARFDRIVSVRRGSSAPLLAEPPGILGCAADKPSRHHDLRVIGFFKEHRAWQPDCDFLLVICHHACNACDGAIFFLAIIQFDHRDDVRHSFDECADDRLHHDDVAVDYSFPCCLEPSDIHRHTFTACGNVRRKPFVTASIASAHQVLLLAGRIPPFAGVGIGKDAEFRVVDCHRHVMNPFNTYAAIPRRMRQLAMFSQPHAIPQQIRAFFT